MKAIIITIGDEILLGQILDTNSQYISRQLTRLGAEVADILSIADQREEIWQWVDYAMKQAELIIVTGGLGPTKDDVTKKVLAEYREWLDIVKMTAMQHSIPLRVELMDLIYRESNEIGAAAEARSLGFNETRLHPDIYMNELLVGMRTIHQILPFIMKKIGIYDEFHLDESDFYLNNQK